MIPRPPAILALDFDGVICDRLRGEVGDEFRRVDRRLLRLEAKLYG